MSLRKLTRVMRPAAIGVIYCLVLGAPARAAEIKRLNLDDANALGTIVSADQMVKFEGKGSIRIFTKWPTTICLGQISGLNLDNAKLVYQAKVKSEGLEGTAFLEMWCQVGAGQYFSRGLNSTVTGTKTWQTLSTPFRLQKGQKAQKATLNLVINGKGTVWIDDIQLLKQPLN
jgi:hypothetical protein